jgi:hypothetical protein
MEDIREKKKMSWIRGQRAFSQNTFVLFNEIKDKN